MLATVYQLRLRSPFICVLHQIFCVLASKKINVKKKSKYIVKIQITKKNLRNKATVY